MSKQPIWAQIIYIVGNIGDGTRIVEENLYFCLTAEGKNLKKFMSAKSTSLQNISLT
jgi:hypothetical protein